MLSWASLGRPGRLLTVDAAEPKFHVLMGKPGANEKKGEGPFMCKGPEQGLSPWGIVGVWRSFWLTRIGNVLLASNTLGPEMQLNVLQCTGRPLPAKNYLGLKCQKCCR